MPPSIWAGRGLGWQYELSVYYEESQPALGSSGLTLHVHQEWVSSGQDMGIGQWGQGIHSTFGKGLLALLWPRQKVAGVYM